MIMKTETLIVLHQHRSGITTYLAIVPEGYTPELEELIEEFDIDFDEEKEALSWDTIPSTEAEPKKIGFNDAQGSPEEKRDALPKGDKKKVHIKPYDTDTGVEWEILFGDEVVDDAFQSTADAEMWAVDNGYEVVYEEEKEWNIPVLRTGYAHRLMAVSARSESEAIEKAIDEAGGEEFSENSSEYSAPDGAHLID